MTQTDHGGSRSQIRIFPHSNLNAIWYRDSHHLQLQFSGTTREQVTSVYDSRTYDNSTVNALVTQIGNISASDPHCASWNLSDGVFTVEEVEEQLSILNPYKSTGPDGLGPRILKETAEVISDPLTNIFNRSLETGIVTDDWKRTNVTPIFKNGNKQIPNNYRPISLTSVISKTIERLLKVRITKHLNDQNLINDTQHGFREKRSCLTNLLDFFGEVNRIYDSTKAVDLVYLDIQKAFYKVPHERHGQSGSAWNTRQLLPMDTKLAHRSHSTRSDSR
ncbi:Reverse transcriptase domain [Trinorchestia longiramus]|nr:Reverse transcriptase domain [Trinorchestia longiramus]